MNREATTEAFREAVLEALDTAANKTFMQTLHQNHKNLRNDSGATDADLPRLFKAIDEQVNVLAERYGITLTDD